MKNINGAEMLLHFVDQSGDTLGISRIDPSDIDMVALHLETIGLLLSFRKIARAQDDLETLFSEPFGRGITHSGSGANAEKYLHVFTSQVSVFSIYVTKGHSAPPLSR